MKDLVTNYSYLIKEFAIITGIYLGTTRAMQEGELVGAMSSAALALVGIATAVLTPYILMLLR
jgi:putative effector of murein hydrolase